MSNELLQKVITSNVLNAQTGGGALNRRQSDRFIDYITDQTVLLPQVRTQRMSSDVQDIDKIGVGRRILRGASEAVDDGINVGVRFTKISLVATKLRADWELSRDSLEDNIEGEDFEDHVVRLMTRQIGQDLEDLAINGNKASSDPLLHHLDGFGVRGNASGNLVDAAGAGMSRKLLSEMIKAMPKRFMARRGGLKFFANDDLVQDYMDVLGDVAVGAVNDPRTLLGDEITPGNGVGYSMMGNGGIRLQAVPLMEGYQYGATAGVDETPGTEDDVEGVAAHDVWLTDPNNLVWGIRRQIEVFNEFKPKKDAIEYTVFTRVAASVEEPNAFVVATNVGVGAATAYGAAPVAG